MASKQRLGVYIRKMEIEFAQFPQAAIQSAQVSDADVANFRGSMHSKKEKNIFHIL